MTEIEAAARLELICGDQKRISEMGYEDSLWCVFHICSPSNYNFLHANKCKHANVHPDAWRGTACALCWHWQAL